MILVLLVLFILLVLRVLLVILVLLVLLVSISRSSDRAAPAKDRTCGGGGERARGKVRHHPRAI